MALPLGDTPKLSPRETDRFMKKMNTAKRGTARYVETPNLKEAEDNIRKTGRAWKKETK